MTVAIQNYYFQQVLLLTASVFVFFKATVLPILPVRTSILNTYF